MVDFSVAIRLYNGASVLPKILDALSAQIITEPISWEIIIIDNNSVDRTANIVDDYQQRWTACPLNYVLEPRQGASFARRRAIVEANGTWIGFLDDDNIPDLHWVQAAYDFGTLHPQAAAFGSQIHPRYETTPPANRSEEHTSELQSPVPISYAVFCLKKKKIMYPHSSHLHPTQHTPSHQQHTPTLS